MDVLVVLILKIIPKRVCMLIIMLHILNIYIVKNKIRENNPYSSSLSGSDLCHLFVLCAREYML